MKKAYSILAALLLTTVAAAQNPTVYFMEGSTLRSQYNPAFAPLRGYFNVPALGGINVSTGGNLSVDRIFFPRDGKLVPLTDSSVSASDALSGLKSRNVLGADYRMNIIGFGAYRSDRKSFWSFDLNLRSNAEVNLPYELLDFVKRGEAGCIRDFGFTADVWLEAGFNYSFPLLDDRLYIGVRGKFLAAMAHARMQFDRFDATLDADRWAIEAAGSLDLFTRDMTVDYAPDGTFAFDDLNYELSPSPAGYGFAVDLGATYDILPGLQASLAVNDLGFISYGKSSAVSGASAKNLSFTGVEVEDGEVLEQPDFDFDLFEFTPEAARGTTRGLRASIYAGMEYEMWNHTVGFGLLYSARFWEYKTLHNLTASVNYHPVSWFSLTGSFSAVGNRGGAVGLALNLCPNGINFFVGTDMLVGKHTATGFLPVKQSNMHLTFGLGVPIGKRGHRVREYDSWCDRF